MAHNSKDEASTMQIDELSQVERELKTRLRQQEVLTKIGQIALTTPSLEALFNATVGLITETLEVEYCEVLRLPQGDSEMLLLSGTGWKPGYVGRATVGTEVESQAGYTLLQNEPVIVTDLGEETRFTAPALLVEHDVVSGMTVIIPGQTRPWGVLGCHSTTARNFTPVDANFLQAVANLLASAIARLSVEASLRTSRDELNIVLQGVADGITVQDLTGRLVYANDAAARLSGYSSAQRLLEAPIEEIVQKFELFDEQGKSLTAEKLPGRKALQGRRSSSARIRFRVRETGEERWSDVKATPVLDQDGQVKLAVNIFRDVTELKRKEQDQRLLAEASELLSGYLDYPATLRGLASMVVPRLADWCSVHIIEQDEILEQVAVAHADPDKLALARELSQKYPPDPDSPAGVFQVIRSGNPALFPEVPENLIEEVAQDGDHYRILRQLGMKSAVLLPLVAREQVLGVMTLIWSESGRRYSQADVELAQELARRAAIAIDNARLYHRAQQLNEELEARVKKRTIQLQQMISSLRDEIAERKKTEQALRESETKLHDLFASAPDATILVDTNGTIKRVNRQVEVLFGYRPNELLGRSIDTLLPGHFPSQPAGRPAKYISAPVMGAQSELSARRKDGSEFPVDVMLSPLESENGPMAIYAVRDISESQRMQAELAEMQRRLVDQMEAERSNLARELHDGPIQDIYGVIFQLRAMSGGEKVEEENEPKAQVASAADAAQDVVQALRAICGELLPPTLAPYGLEKAIREHASNFQKAHPEINLNLELTKDDQQLPERLRLALFRVYQNAVSNIVRHAQAENVSICFELHEEECTLEIKDDGKGFEVPSRWVKFARKGHLGLVGMVERIKAVGGHTHITSAPGEGTSIQVRVPRGDR
ncbi:MAG TPA: PAS domain S-box protein [Anaerolineales bacterium]